MQALQYNRPGKLILKDLPIPEPAGDEVLVKVSHAGICGTDIHILAEEAPSAAVVVPGHEFSGTVAATGENVTHLKPGERVCVDPNNYCGHCNYCRCGEVHFCRNLKPVGVFRDGAWAEYCIAPANQVYSLPDTVPLNWGALCEPISCILHGWDRIQPVSPGCRILILGGGIIGILWGLMLRQYRFNNLTFSEPVENRRKILAAWDFSPLTPAKVAETFRKEKQEFDVIIDCSGFPPAVEEAFGWIAPLGKFLFFGVCPHDSRIKMNPFQVFKKELTLVGSIINPFTFSRAIRLIEDIQRPLSSLGVNKYPLSEYQTAIEAVKSGRVTKGMFVTE
jgi:2-desacetyl-2-hydroxyethyl bacteriochlorophyllide A dehydrogenase